MKIKFTTKIIPIFIKLIISLLPLFSGHKISTKWDVKTQPHQSWIKDICTRSAATLACIPILLIPLNANAAPISIVEREGKYFAESVLKSNSRGWELARQKRTIAVKKMEEKGMLKVNTNVDTGDQYLSLPWLPGRKLIYKSLPISQKLVNELYAGALGEISKDFLLHAVDTAKTRKQANSKRAKQLSISATGVDDNKTLFEATTTTTSSNSENIFEKVKNLYAGFPVVLLSSIPQGGAFFLVKRGVIELLALTLPQLPVILSSSLPIGFGVMAYWIFRTPAEVIKVQVQTGQYDNVTESFLAAKSGYSNGVLGLWKHYLVMLSLDIPFQIINFILFGLLSNYVLSIGIETSILSRLFCGTTCGMISAGLTCPLDVCKTRIIARDRENMVLLAATSNSNSSSSLAFEMTNNNVNETANVSLRNDDINININTNNNIVVEMISILKTEGPSTLFLGLAQRLLYVGLANGIRLAAYGTSRVDLMMKSLDAL